MSLYDLPPGLLRLTTKALGSDCKLTFVNWDTTIDFRPCNLLPSQDIPHIPKRDRREQLNTYTELPLTLLMSKNPSSSTDVLSVANAVIIVSSLTASSSPAFIGGFNVLENALSIFG